MDKTKLHTIQKGREESFKGMGSTGIGISQKKLLFIPRYAQGEGTGHLARCAMLAKKFGGNAYILSSFGDENIESYFSASPSDQDISGLRFFPSISEWHKDDLIAVDRRSTSIKELSDLSSHGIPIGLDEGGSGRPYFPYLIDTLPILSQNPSCAPNKVSIHAADKSKRSVDYSHPFKKILISFGGEDRADCSLKLLESLLQHGIFESGSITLVEGPLFRRHEWPERSRVVRNPESMDGLIREADCLFTHFGLTCFEALSIGTPVILFNPTSYHRALSISSRIPEIGMGKPRIRKLRKLISDRSVFDESLTRARRYMSEQSADLFSIINALEPDNRNVCPLCGKSMNKAIARLEDRTYVRCSICDSMYLLDFLKVKKTYGRSYFFDEYSKQYGKTYLEDFENIKRRGANRLSVIDSLMEKKRDRDLYEIGCAFGPFLSAAHESGINASGCDVSGEASEYVNKTLGLKCDLLDFEDEKDSNPIFKTKYDIIALWYVIEHFKHPDIVLKRINAMLVRGGILALSTPNGRGISGKMDPRLFLKNSPRDHHTVWDRHSAQNVLSKFGFRLKKIRITGHHPERFPIVKKSNMKSGFLFRFVSLMSVFLGLGDTFEAYAVKERDI